jgi:hypothetical protein
MDAPIGDTQPRLYAHWLDGEWQKIAYPILVEGPYSRLQQVAEGALKLHALFGTHIVISDVQLTDSLVVVRLFANPEFRDYLRSDPQFLTLVAHPTPGISNRKLAIATRGMARAFPKGWRTSLNVAPQLPALSVEVIKRLAETILNPGTLDTAYCFRIRSRGPGKVIADHPEHKELLEGMLRGICHFAREARRAGPVDVPAASVPDRSYADFIRDALSNAKLPPEEWGALESIWRSICEKWVPDESKRFRRSDLLTALEDKEPNRIKWPPEFDRLWNTVVHAWNSNVSDTVGAGRNSISPLPHAVVPFRGEISDVAGPFVERGELVMSRDIRRYPILSLNPSTLSWKTVRGAIQGAHGERARFGSALARKNSEGIIEASSELIRKLAPIVAKGSSLKEPGRIWDAVFLAGLFGQLPIVRDVAGVGSAYYWLRGLSRTGMVMNTLHGFRKDLITIFDNKGAK